MSDPVTSAEVEDVLSSIRRLVSEERRPSNRSKMDAPAEDKLVLTPSLRVSNEKPLVDAYKKQQQEPVPTEWGDDADDEAALSGADDIEPTHADMPPVADLSEKSKDDSFDVPEDERFSDVNSFDGADEFEDFDLIADESEFDLPETSVAKMTSESDEEDEETETVEDAVERHQLFNRPSGMLNLGTSELVEDEPRSPDLLSAKIAALETAISRIPETWEPDEPDEDEYSGSKAPAIAWEDDVDLDATGIPIAPTSSKRSPAPEAEEYVDEDAFEEEDKTKEPSDSGIGFGGEEYFDEDMLRDLVSEIVRSELQGALGERITRNVRKLVRREIHRALTAQELE